MSLRGSDVNVLKSIGRNFLRNEFQKSAHIETRRERQRENGANTLYVEGKERDRGQAKW